MTVKKNGLMRGDLIGLLIGAVLLGGLLVYGALSEQALPLWPALMVVGVNLLAAFNIIRRVRAGRMQRQPTDKSPTNTP